LLVDSSGLTSPGGDRADVSDAASDGPLPADADPAEAADVQDASDVDAPAIHPYVQAVLADGPSLYYRLEETSGTIAKDETGNHPGTYLSGGGHGAAGAFPGSSALRLSGPGGVSSGDIFDFEGTVAFTLEAWLRPEGYDDQYRFLFHHNDESGLRQNYGIYVQATNGLTFERYVDGDGRAASTDNPDVGSWHHIVGVYTGAVIQLYLDGTLVSASTDPRAAKEKRSILTIGFGYPGGEGALKGTLDELAVYEKALDPDRIAAHFHAAQ